MKIKELISKLKKYNPDATVNVVVNSTPKDFKICFGSSEGVSKNSCEDVSFMVDCTEETAK
ncbi:MAG: hypothetical protein IJA80_02435 [Clostridia bacterium]|nr:hypothetical protein [Clostridia bacterium]